MTESAERFSLISHGEMPLWNPMPLDVLDGALASLASGEAPLDGTLDLGCGAGEALIRMYEQHGAVGVGIDRSKAAIEEARRRAAARSPEPALRWRAEAVDAAPVEAGSVNRLICIGSSQAVGGFDELLACAHRWVTPGGRVLVGELGWAASPSVTLLEALGCAESEMPFVGEMEAAARAVGFETAFSRPLTRTEFDAYEDAYAANMAAHLKRHPDDPDHRAFAARVEGWSTLRRDHAGEAFGFGVLVLERPSVDA